MTATGNDGGCLFFPVSQKAESGRREASGVCVVSCPGTWTAGLSAYGTLASILAIPLGRIVAILTSEPRTKGLRSRESFSGQEEAHCEGYFGVPGSCLQARGRC